MNLALATCIQYRKTQMTLFRLCFLPPIFHFHITQLHREGGGKIIPEYGKKAEAWYSSGPNHFI